MPRGGQRHGRKDSQPSQGQKRKTATKGNTHPTSKRQKRQPIRNGKTTEKCGPQSNIHWDTLEPVPSAVENFMKAKLVAAGEWGKIPAKKLVLLGELIRKERLKITCDQAASLRHQLLQEKSANCHHRLQGQKSAMLQKYLSGQSVMSISRSCDYPPVALLRAILVERDWLSPKKLKDVLKHPHAHLRTKLLDERDVENIAEASENDIVTSADQDQSAANAERFEDFLCNYLERKNVSFLRQDEVSAQQVHAPLDNELNLITHQCAPAVLLLYSYCTPTVLLLYSYCTPTVLLLYSYCTPTVLLLYSYCTPTMLLLCSYCTPTVLLLYSYYAPTVLLLCSYCTPTMLLLCSTVLLLYSLPAHSTHRPPFALLYSYSTPTLLLLCSYSAPTGAHAWTSSGHSRHFVQRPYHYQRTSNKLD
jgi:hypothetical protein